VNLPHLLLVDDSRAVLAFEQAALSALYGLSIASNGVEALRKARAVRPDGILLDLSMPEMNGAEVLAALKADAQLSEVPVIVISSEVLRAEACLQAGAAAFLAKPIQAAPLRALVARTLEEAQRRVRRGATTILAVGAGGAEIGLPIESVQQVLHQLPTHLLPFGPPYLRETFDLGGDPVGVLDLAEALGLQHAERLADRKLVVLAYEHLRLALCVDWVRDPEEIPSLDVIAPERVGGALHGALAQVLRGIVRTQRGPLAIVDPVALLSPERLVEVAAALASAVDRGGTAGA
jgi:CheY-like chemotaxis protein